MDDDWLIQEVTDAYVSLQNLRTQHMTMLGLDHTHSFTSDPQRDIGGLKHGFLALHVQLTVTPKGVLIDLLQRR